VGIVTLLIDPRAGSKDLLEPLQKLGLPAEAEQLEYGDVSFVGNGPTGPRVVAIEFKQITEILSCITTQRFSEQLRGMHELYSEQWLLVEGNWFPDLRDTLLVDGHRPYPHSKWKFSEVTSWLIDVSSKGGMRVWQTKTRQETLAWIRCLYLEWQKRWTSRTATAGLYEAPLTIHDDTPLRKPSQAWRTAATWPGLGSEKGRRAAQHFKTVKAMVDAPAEEWTKIDGIGDTLAEKIQRALVEEHR
jgi:ERCC4-type nuclease